MEEYVLYAIDFEYDGQYLSDYGFIICKFESSSGATIADAGSKITFEKVARNKGKQFSLVNTKYEECVTTSFDICKNPDIYDDYDDRLISNDEYRDLMRWLNRREYLKFQVFDEDDNIRDTCYYNVSFNVEKIKIADRLFGLRLTLESDKPFGYGQEQSVTWEFSDVTVSKILSDMSDEIGYVYPDMRIYCNADGDLSIYNELENCTMTIKNCQIGEIITVKGKEQIITSSYASHDIVNDFNFEFFKIGNTIDNRNNRISVSALCTVTITYSPIIKDTP